MNVPKLRFKEFSGEWHSFMLGDIATFYKGKNLSKADIVEGGINPCIRYGELYTVYGEAIKEIVSYTNLSLNESFLSVSNDVIIPASGETQIDIAKASCVMLDDIILGGDLNVVRLKENGLFISYYLNSKKKIEIAKLAQGNAVVHLYASQLKQLFLKIPSIEEQTKIASFLTAVDEKITQLTQKHELLSQYKKGVMQQIFSQQLRFKDDNGEEFGEWEEVEIGEVVAYEQPQKYLVSSTEYNDLFEIPVLTAGKTFVLGYTDETTGIYHAAENNVIIFDDFTTAYKFVNFSFKAKSSAMKILKPIDKEKTNIKFIFEVMSEINFSLGDEHKRRWISEYSKEIIPYPSLPEQTKIANFLSSIDQKIEQAAAQLDAAKQYKRGLLQQMFV